MKTSILHQNHISDSVVDLINRMVVRIPWPARRLAMADVTQSLLSGKVRVAEYVFGWNRARIFEKLKKLANSLSGADLG